MVRLILLGYIIEDDGPGGYVSLLASSLGR